MTTASSSCGKDDFHRERSRFLDAFAELEAAVASKPIPLSDHLADLLKSLRAIRNDLVHSKLRFLVIDGTLQALVINPQGTAKVTRTARVVALDDFKALKSQIGQVRKHYR
jgi:hypothetical protein